MNDIICISEIDQEYPHMTEKCTKFGCSFAAQRFVWNTRRRKARTGIDSRFSYSWMLSSCKHVDDCLVTGSDPITDCDCWSCPILVNSLLISFERKFIIVLWGKLFDVFPAINHFLGSNQLLLSCSHEALACWLSLFALSDLCWLPVW